MRAGIHTGEIEISGDDGAGMAVDIGAGCQLLPVQVRSWSRRRSKISLSDPISGSPNGGYHELKGVPGTWRLFAVIARLEFRTESHEGPLSRRRTWERLLRARSMISGAVVAGGLRMRYLQHRKCQSRVGRSGP